MQQILGRSGANWRPPILCFHDIKLAKTGALCRLDLRGRCREKLSAVRWAAFSPSARNARQEAFNFLAQGAGGHFQSLRSREDVSAECRVSASAPKTSPRTGTTIFAPSEALGTFCEISALAELCSSTATETAVAQLSISCMRSEMHHPPARAGACAGVLSAILGSK